MAALAVPGPSKVRHRSPGCKMMTILHNSMDAVSRVFVESHGAGRTVVDWYCDDAARQSYMAAGHPYPSAFPSVCVDVPAYHQDAVTVDGVVISEGGDFAAHSELIRLPASWDDVEAFISDVNQRAENSPPMQT